MVGEAIMESPRRGLDLIITESLFVGDIEGNIGGLRGTGEISQTAQVR
jgi:hypothetical protein